MQFLNTNYPSIESEEEEQTLDDFLGISDAEETNHAEQIQTNPFMNFQPPKQQRITHSCQMPSNNFYSSQMMRISQNSHPNLFPQNYQNASINPHYTQGFNFSNFQKIPFSTQDFWRNQKKMDTLSMMSTTIPDQTTEKKERLFDIEKDPDFVKEFKFNNLTQNQDKISFLKVEEWIQKNHKFKIPRSKKRAIQKLYLFLRNFSNRTLTKKDLLKSIATIINKHNLSNNYLSSMLCVNKIFIGEKLSKLALSCYLSKLMILEMMIMKNFRVGNLRHLTQIEDNGETWYLLELLRKF